MPRAGPHHYTAYDRAHKDDTATRMAARRLMIRTYGEDKAKGMDVDHVKPLVEGGSGRDIHNLRFRDPGANRGDKSFQHDHSHSAYGKKMDG